MPTEVLITGLGVVSPIGVGAKAVWESLREQRSGVRMIPELERAGWLAPFGGEVVGFDPKEHVQPRKSLKVMSRETQLAFAAGEMAWADAGLEGAEVDPERVGVIGAAGLQYCPLDELADPVAESRNGEGVCDLVAWGEHGMRRLFPLWMLKYLPNMAACHVGIRRQACGPTNTVSLGAVSSLVALGEAFQTIRRGAADAMLVGGTSSRIDTTDLVSHAGAGLSMRTDSPEKACRPFDADRDGAVCGEGAAYFVAESREHAERRGFFLRDGRAWASVESVVSRCENSVTSHAPTGKALEQACRAALEASGCKPADLAMVKAHGVSRPEADALEAQALMRVIGDAPVFAPTSYFGSLGAAGGAVELAAALIGLSEGISPATLNYETPDPDCPVNVSAEHRDASGEVLLAVNQAVAGQAVAAVLGRC